MEQELNKFDKLRVNPDSFEKIKNLHENLYYGAVKALLGQLGKLHFKQLPEYERLKLAKCLDKIENRYDLVSPAKCLIQSRDRLILLLKEENKLKDQIYFNFDEEKEILKNNEVIVTFGGIKVAQKLPSKRMEKLKRAELKAKFFKINLNNKQAELKDFTKHPHMLSRILIPLAQMRLQKYGGNVLRRRVKRERNEEKTEKMIGIEEMKKIREEIQKQRETDPKENFKVRTANNVDPLSNGKENNLAAKISSLLVKSLGPKSKNADIKWAKTYKTLQRLSEQIERGKNFPGSNLYEKRMFVDL
uniref:Uncharacterized protein n=1 Tax=Meloidogyne floridensis TaxID=298350 RepID=A0A915P1D5_9BILA